MIEHWFPTPIWHFNLDLEEKDYQEAINYCQDLKNTDQGVTRSNVGGWQSNAFGIETLTKDNPLNRFFEQCIPFFYVCGKDLDMDESKIISYQKVWININKKGDFNKKHWHGNFALSGVFYLTDKNSNICFYKNKDFMDYTLLQFSSNFQTSSSYTVVSYTPIKGSLLLFPSWLEHDVYPSKEDDDRISVAFNLMVK